MIKNKFKKAFTLTELIMVIAIIWVLMMWMTVYISWSSERTQIIEAEWCATSLWWVMDNYLYYALTSKVLSSWNNKISPNFYYIQLSWFNTDENCVSDAFESSWALCNQILLWYSTGELVVWENPAIYQTLTTKNTCSQNQSRIWFYRSWWDNPQEKNIDFIKMNKWFSPTNITDQNVFYIQNRTRNNKLLLWEIIIVLCSDDECSWRKQIAKRVVDARPQTISLKKCKFYEEDDPIRCQERED